MKKRLLLISLVLTVLLAVFPASAVFADTSEAVTVTATPAYIACANDPDTWTLNDIVGAGAPKGTIYVDTLYYSNPLGDTTAPSDPVVNGECRFTLTNTSTIVTDAFANMGAFTGGSANMTNSDDVGANGATTYGAFSYCTGMTYSTGKVVCKSTGSLAFKSDLAATTNIKWGIALETRTDAWTGGTPSTATLTVSLAAA